MKTDIKISIMVILLSMVCAGYAQTVDPPYEVGTWQGFRKVAISFTFDDGSPNQFTKVIPMFNEFNFKLTLFTVTSHQLELAGQLDHPAECRKSGT